MGIFWTVDQKFSEQRARIFKSAEATLSRTRESVYLSPEGERVTNGVIGHFNKGSFHLATNLKAPIVPIYIAIPRSMDPGTGLRARPGTVRVYIKPAISTQHWRLEDLSQNKEKVRDLFVQWHREHKP
jgi:1-acyl-sn-glycerol-3-phosphate acyltransferase